MGHSYKDKCPVKDASYYRALVRTHPITGLLNRMRPYKSPVIGCVLTRARLRTHPITGHLSL